MNKQIYAILSMILLLFYIYNAITNPESEATTRLLIFAAWADLIWRIKDIRCIN